jgi:hypothetical protein
MGLLKEDGPPYRDIGFKNGLLRLTTGRQV